MKLYNQNTGEYNFVMAYPAAEEFALSSVGYLWLYKIADTMQGINAIRTSTDNNDLKLKNIDSIAFSLSFDFDFTGVFEILEKLKIPFLKNDRDDTFPLIFAGGPVITTNPVPYEDIFDFMLLGDGEETFSKVLECLKLKLPKQETLKIFSEIEGIFIHDKPSRKSVAKLSEVVYTPILSENSYFKNTFIVEVARGCMNRCAFCTASYLNQPYRYCDYRKITDIIDFGLMHTDKIALLGAQITSHPDFNNIINHIKTLMDKGRNIELGISSLRTDAITSDLVKILVRGGQKHSTIAIEAASERLRKFINKNLSEEQILNAVKISHENGLKGLKIYSMIGIPTETENDIKEFITLAKKIKNENNGFNIEFSFSTFVPKPQTPFQWAKREDTKSLEAKQNYLQKEFAKIGIPAKFSSAKWDYWQTVLSRGDKNITPLMIDAYNNGGKAGAYKNSAKKLNINLAKYTDGQDFSAELPWDNIYTVETKQLLKNEYERLVKKSIG